MVNFSRNYDPTTSSCVHAGSTFKYSSINAYLGVSQPWPRSFRGHSGWPLAGQLNHMPGRLLVLLLLVTSTPVQHYTETCGSLLLVKAERVVVVHTGQQLADAIARFGRSGEDTQIVLKPPPGQQHISLEAVNFTTLTTSSDGSQPYSKGTVTIRGDADRDSPVILDTAMRANITSPALSGSAKVHLGSNLVFVNMCDNVLKINNNDPRWVLVTAANLGLIPRSRTYRSQHHDSTMFYVRGSSVASYLYFGLAQMSPFHKVRQRALPLLANLPLLETSVLRATDDPALYGLNSSYPGATSVNVTYKAITHTQDPLVQWLNSTGRLMKPRFCVNGSELPTSIIQEELSPWTGPLCMASTPVKLRHCLNTIANLTGHKRPVPAVMQLFNTSFTSDMLPGGVLTISGAMMLIGPVYQDPNNLKLSQLDFQRRNGTIFLEAEAQLFLQQMVLSGLKQQILPSALDGTTSATASALPLAAISITDSLSAWASQPPIQMHDCTLVLPDDDYLALLVIASGDQDSNLLNCVDESILHQAAALRTGITSIRPEAVDPSFLSVTLCNFTGWGIRATNLTLQPEGRVAALQLQHCQQLHLASSSADSEAPELFSAETRIKLLGSILAPVGVCLILLAILSFSQRHRSKRQSGHKPISTQPHSTKQVDDDLEHQSRQQPSSWQKHAWAIPPVAMVPQTATCGPITPASTPTVNTTGRHSSSSDDSSSKSQSRTTIGDAAVTQQQADSHPDAPDVGSLHQLASFVAVEVVASAPGTETGAVVDRTNAVVVEATSAAAVKAANGAVIKASDAAVVEAPNAAMAEASNAAILEATNAGVVKASNDAAVQASTAAVVEATSAAMVGASNERGQEAHTDASAANADRFGNAESSEDDGSSEYYTCLGFQDGPLQQAGGSVGSRQQEVAAGKATALQGGKGIAARRPVAIRMVRQRVPVLDAAAMPSHVLLSWHSVASSPEGSTKGGDQFKQLIAAKAVGIQGRTDKVVLQGVLGSGAWGMVYAGEWRGLPVAVKTLVFELPGQQALSVAHGLIWPGSAIMETAIAASVGHRNLVSTYCYDIKPVKAHHAAGPGGLQVEEAFQAEDGQSNKPGYMAYKLLLVQELCGSSLSVVLDKGALVNKRTGRPDEFWVVCLLLDIAEGLHYLHTHNIVHGDLKPANILLKPDSTRPIGVVAKLADFGLSCYLADASHVSNCHVGTPFHTAPEVVAHGRVSTAADIFSLGVIIWQLYSSKRPCVQDESGRWQWQPDFGQFGKGQEPCKACWDLEYRCLQHDASLRPTAQEAVEVLSAVLGLTAVTPAARTEGAVP